MLDTMADRPCDTKFRCDADDWRACGEFIKSLVWWEWDTPCRFPMFSIVSSIVEKIFISTPRATLSLSLSLPLPLSLYLALLSNKFETISKPSHWLELPLRSQSSMVLKDRVPAAKQTAARCVKVSAPAWFLSAEHLLLYPKRCSARCVYIDVPALLLKWDRAWACAQVRAPVAYPRTREPCLGPIWRHWPPCQGSLAL